VWISNAFLPGGVNVKPVDTTGAGDAFVSGILYNIASDPSIFEVIHIFLHILVVYSEKSYERLEFDEGIFVEIKYV